MKVLILVAIPHFDYNNEKSAVLSWMKLIKSAFEEQGHVVFFADITGGNSSENFSSNKKENSIIKGLKSLLKSWPWFYYSLVFRKYFKAQSLMSQKIEEKYKCDLVVEFHIIYLKLSFLLAPNL